MSEVFLLHLAYQTRDKVGTQSDSRYAGVNLEIDAAVLYALERRAPAGVFVASSGMAERVATGKIRDLYGALKLVQEDRFVEIGRRGAFPVLVGRIFNIAGPYVNKHPSYALASFLTQGLSTGRIRISAAGPVFRSYVHVLDLVRVVLAELGSGAPHAGPLRIAGSEVVEMQDVAEAAARTLGLPLSAIEREPNWKEPVSSYLGDPCDFHALALRHGIRLVGFEQQVQDTAGFLTQAARADGLTA